MVPSMLVGVDVTVIDRIAAALHRTPRFSQRIFTEQERRSCGNKAEKWASRWAAKEAVRKLCSQAGQRMPAYHDIEVVRDRGHAPRVRIAGAETDIALTLTHDGGLAIAVAASTVPVDLGLAAPVSLGLRLPERPAQGHKGTFGHVVVVAGSRALTGAPRLAAMGAARGGAGLVTLCVPEAIHAIVAAGCLEVMPVPLPDAGSGTLMHLGLARATKALAAADAAVIGPGLGRADASADATRSLIASLPCPAVIDADALTLAAATGLRWRDTSHPLVLTPHPGEMSRLAGIDIAAVQADRAGVATRYASEHGVVVVLKGARTIVAGPRGEVVEDGHEVVALATGGTGDVLAGLTGAMLAQGLAPVDAAVAAVAIHAEAGIAVQRLRGRAGAIASDLLDALPLAQERIRRELERATSRR